MEITEPTVNAPCWVDLYTSEPEAARRFYGELLGWVPESDPDPEAGGYTLCYLGDDPVAAVSPLMSSEQPVAWGMQVLTVGVQDLVQRVVDNGGSVLAGPMDVLDQGRFATAVDPTGAVFGLWQARSFAGAGRFNSAGALTWLELASNEPERARDFYREVFGWSTVGGQDSSTTSFAVGDRAFAGLTSMGDQVPLGVPPHWLVFFETGEVEDAANAATALGGQVRVAPRGFGSEGRYAVLADPQGATFAVRSG